jgi:hypothetical protein
MGESQTPIDRSREPSELGLLTDKGRVIMKRQRSCL